MSRPHSPLQGGAVPPVSLTEPPYTAPRLQVQCLICHTQDSVAHLAKQKKNAQGLLQIENLRQSGGHKVTRISRFSCENRMKIPLS